MESILIIQLFNPVCLQYYRSTHNQCEMMYKTFPSLLFVCLFLILCLWHLCILHTHHISVPTSPFQELLLIVCGSWLHTDNETLEHPLASNILVFSNFIFGLRLECQCVLMYTVFYGLKHWEERCLMTIKDSWLAHWANLKESKHFYPKLDLNYWIWGDMMWGAGSCFLGCYVGETRRSGG